MSDGVMDNQGSLVYLGSSSIAELLYDKLMKKLLVAVIDMWGTRRGCRALRRIVCKVQRMANGTAAISKLGIGAARSTHRSSHAIIQSERH